VTAEASKIAMRSGLIACIVILLPVISDLGRTATSQGKGDEGSTTDRQVSRTAMLRKGAEMMAAIIARRSRQA
jgi:hypothetical protein